MPDVVRKLLDAGYDVYINNRRGTPLSSENPKGYKEAEFWDWDTEFGKIRATLTYSEYRVFYNY